MIVDIFDVEMGQCAIIHATSGGRIAMVDCGHNSSTDWTPSSHIVNKLNRTQIDYLFITNADEDHFSDLDELTSEIGVVTFIRASGISADQLRAVKQEQCGLSRDAEEYIRLHGTYTAPVPIPFDSGMGGITAKTFLQHISGFQGHQ